MSATTNNVEPPVTGHPSPSDDKDRDIRLAEESASGPSSEPDSEGSTQDGIKQIEAVARAWSKWGLIVAYIGIFLMAYATSQEGQVSYSFQPMATSSFGLHSLMSTVGVVQQIVLAVAKPIMAKVGDVFGRLEAFSFSVLLFVLGYIMQAASQNVETFAAAQIFYSSGSTGLQILQQVFIADTSDLLWRAFFSSLPDVPFLITVWTGPEIVASVLARSNWRWGYGMWAIVLPIAFLPFALSLFLNKRKAARMGLVPPRKTTNLLRLAVDLDIVGLILISGAFALLLIPLTIATNQSQGYNTPSMIVMLVLGFVCFIAIPFWEGNKKLCPHPVLPLGLLRSRTFTAGCLLGFFYFMVFYMSAYPYYYSYLMVAQNIHQITAGHITQTFSFASTVASLGVGLLIKFTRHYKYYVTVGSVIYLMGIGLMIRYRTAGVSWGPLVGTQICVGIGGGMLNVPAQLGIQADASHQTVAAATAAFLTMVQLGGAVGNAISGAIWSNVVKSTMYDQLPVESKNQTDLLFGNYMSALELPWGSPEREAVNAAYQAGMHRLLTVAVCLCVPIVLLSLVMRNINLDEAPQNVKGRVIGGQVNDDEKRMSESPVFKRGWLSPSNWRRNQARADI